MSLVIHNSLSGKKDLFTAKGQVGVYICGVTPYDITHLGHAFTYVQFDVVVRYLRHLGHKVTYVQNLTDIDDDLLKKSKELKENWRKLAEKNTSLFLEDLRFLNNLQPDILPRATDSIPEIIKLAQGLLEKGYAYEKNGSVYYDVSKFTEFGKLSKLPKEEWLRTANERGNFADDPNKRNPLDFVLWQAQKPKEPCWQSPWGKGRPGWHIECSAMSMKYLGSTIDIHGGGRDLIFPHHECSIAQSEALTGQQFVRYWMHTAMVRYQGQKMSKSLGNMVFVKDFKKFGTNAARICILTHHYRKAWGFEEQEKENAREMAKLFDRVWLCQSGQGTTLCTKGYEKQFYAAMNDDFDTPEALRVLGKLAKDALRDSTRDITDAKALLSRAFNVLGLVITYA